MCFGGMLIGWENYLVYILLFFWCFWNVWYIYNEVKFIVNKVFIGEIFNFSIMGLMFRLKFGVLREGIFEYVDF